MATNTTTTDYQLNLKGFVGGNDFDANYVDYILSKHEGKDVHVLIDSLGGRSNSKMSTKHWEKTHRREDWDKIIVDVMKLCPPKNS